MPVPNDLTPEEEAEFGQHGVPPAGPGREPLSEAPPQQQEQQQQSEQHQTDEGQGRQTFHRQDGRFASREEAEAGKAKPSQRQAGQQEPGQQGQQQEEPGQEGQQEGQDNRTVPLAALHQERLQRQAVARRAQLTETRLNAILSRETPQTQVPQMPDINTDPAGYVMALEERLNSFEKERVESLQNQQLDSSISSDEDMFTQVRPDYPQASDYFVQSRAQELLAFYPPAEAQKMMLAEARQIARAAWERGQSVGEVIYGLAQARGYNPGMPQRQPAPQQQGGQPAPQQRRGPAAGDVVDSINRGQAAGRSLSGSGGASPESLNANAILDMSDEEFAGWLGEGNSATRKFAAIG